jgi:hypothetical protein
MLSAVFLKGTHHQLIRIAALKVGVSVVLIVQRLAPRRIRPRPRSSNI